MIKSMNHARVKECSEVISIIRLNHFEVRRAVKRPRLRGDN